MNKSPPSGRLFVQILGALMILTACTDAGVQRLLAGACAITTCEGGSMLSFV